MPDNEDKYECSDQCKRDKTLTTENDTGRKPEDSAKYFEPGHKNVSNF